MNEIEFDVTALRDFAQTIREVRYGMDGLVQQISAALNSVAESWKDDSIVRAEEKLSEINPQVLQACEQLESIVERRARALEDLGGVYNSIV